MKKPLLFLTTVLITFLSSFGQVPGNDLIANATLINSFPFSDSDVRLDLATASSISPAGCPTGNYKLVYYKFTAAESSQFEVFIEDANNGPTGTSFAIILTAPSLNVTDETELNIMSVCGFTSSTYLDLVEGTNYYVLIHRNVANALSNIVFENTPLLPVPTSERDALIALYNSTNGDTWTTNTNWNSTEPVANWHGIRTINIDGVGHVSEIRLGGNDLTGTLPAEIGNFPQLNYLGLWANQITGTIPPEIGNLIELRILDITPNTFSGSIPEEIGNLVNLEVLWLNQCGTTGNIPSSFQNLVNLRELYLTGSVSVGSEWSSSSYSGDFPDLTGLPLEILRMENNFFTFEDIANEFATYQANIPNFIFNPQYTVDPPENIASEVGEDITLTLTDVPGTTRQSSNRMTANSYQWLKDDILIPDANASTYTIINAQNSDSGIYSCEITNADVPGFIITRSGITVDVGGTLSIDDTNLNSIVSIYPNPSQSLVNIRLPESNNSAHIILYNLLGKKMLQLKVNQSLTELNLAHLQNGVYLVQITLDNKNTLVKKLIISR